MLAHLELEYRQVADQRAGDGTALWRIEGERTGAVHVVPAVGEHRQIQGIPQEAQRSEWRQQDLPLHGQPHDSHLQQEQGIHEGIGHQVHMEHSILAGLQSNRVRIQQSQIEIQMLASAEINRADTR